MLIPYSFGILAAGGSLRHTATRFTLALFFLFAARIVLKDFRDREGDARYGKPTLLLRFGKSFTCGASLCALIAGDGVLVASLDPVLALFAQPFVLSVAWMLWRLWRADDPHGEQVSIGIGARMGNGLLLCILAWFVTESQGASPTQTASLTGALSALFFLSFASLAARPHEAVIGYKG